GVLHGGGAFRDQIEALGKSERAGGCVGGEFAERETRRGCEGKIGQALAQGGEAGEAVHVERGLADGGLREFLGGALEHDLAQRIAELGIRLLEEGSGGGGGGDEILAHADGLGALTSEEKRD